MFHSPLGWLIILSMVLSAGGYIISKLYNLSLEMTKRNKILVSSIIYFIGYISFFVCFSLYVSKTSEGNFLIDLTALMRRNAVWFVIPSIFQGEWETYLLLLAGGTVPLLLTAAIGAFLAINVLEIEDTRKYALWREDVIDSDTDEIVETSYKKTVTSGESEGSQIRSLIYVVIIGNLFLPVITMGIVGIFYTSQLFKGFPKFLFNVLMLAIVGVIFFIK